MTTTNRAKTYNTRVACILVLLAACNDSAAQPDPGQGTRPLPAPEQRRNEPARCAPAAFPSSVPVREASAATPWGSGRILVLGDSDTGGRYAIIRAHDGQVVSGGRLPRPEGSSDDYEGAARFGDQLCTITSAGTIACYRQQGSEMKLAASYLAAPRGRQCKSPRHTNCGANFEGLCSVPPEHERADGCLGFAASKRSNQLFCLRRAGDGRLTVDPEVHFSVPGVRSLSSCAVGPDGTVFAGTNILGGNGVWRLTNAGTFDFVGSFGAGNGEALAITSGELFRWFDNNRPGPSSMLKVRCTSDILRQTPVAR